MQVDFSSLCVLSYERPEYLRDTLNSIEKKTLTPYELIIHDDGSNDPITREITRGMEMDRSLDIPGSTVILNKPGWNQGQGVALNRMFHMAQGDPIIKLDSDLNFHRGWLAEVTRLMNEHPEIGLLGLLHYYHDPVDSKKTVIRRDDDFSIHTHILGSAFAVRRECWEELGPFSQHSEAFAEDWEFQNKVTESERWVCALPKASLVENVGMGIGKSVLVQKDGEVHPIHKFPYLIANSAQE